MGRKKLSRFVILLTSVTGLDIRRIKDDLWSQHFIFTKETHILRLAKKCMGVGVGWLGVWEGCFVTNELALNILIYELFLQILHFSKWNEICRLHLAFHTSCNTPSEFSLSKYLHAYIAKACEIAISCGLYLNIPHLWIVLSNPIFVYLLTFT